MKIVVTFLLSNFIWALCAVFLCHINSRYVENHGTYVEYYSPDRKGIYSSEKREKENVTGETVERIFNKRNDGLELLSSITTYERYGLNSGAIIVADVGKFIFLDMTMYVGSANKRTKNEIRFGMASGAIEYVDINLDGFYDYKRLLFTDNGKIEFIWLDKRWQEVESDYSVYFDDKPFAKNINDNAVKYRFDQMWLSE